MTLLQSETRTDEVEEIENPPLPLPQDNVKQTDYTYDANGSQLTKTTDDKTEANTYNAANQLVGFTDGDTIASYVYNADGLRIRKTVGNQTVQHIWDGAKQIIADVVDGEFYQATCYVRGTSLAATYEYVDAVKSEYVYYLQNAHGDVVNLTDDDGAVTKTYKYDAFGVEKNISDTDTNAFRYCGEYFDKETGTIYLRARYYNPSTGRFTQRDSFAGKQGEPLSLNLYTYCANNPILYWDPSGHSWQSKVDGFVDNWKLGASDFIDNWQSGINVLTNSGTGGRSFANYSMGVVDTISGQASSTIKVIKDPGQVASNVVKDYVSYGKKDFTNWNPASSLGPKARESLVNQAVSSYNLGSEYGLDGVMYALGQSTTIVAQTGISAYGPQAMSSGFDAINSKLPRTLKGSLYIGDLNFGRSKNKIRPNLNAQGPHSVFKRDPVTGKITNYKTYVSNPRNPTGFDEILGYDGGLVKRIKIQ